MGNWDMHDQSRGMPRFSEEASHDETAGTKASAGSSRDTLTHGEFKKERGDLLKALGASGTPLDLLENACEIMWLERNNPAATAALDPTGDSYNI